MSKTEKKNTKQKQFTRQLINTKVVTDYSLTTNRGDELVYFIIKPTNISVLSEESVSARIYAMMTVLNLGKEGQEESGLALYQPAGLRHEILQELTHH